MSMNNTIMPLYLEEATTGYVSDGKFQSDCVFENVKQVGK
jgi:hypothetical protein